MLTTIRDKLKTWVVILLVILVAIPLIFLGVGDYGTNQERFAFKVNDQEVSKSIVLQEMGQFKDVLRKNYQGSIPPIYTNEFIKKITIDNLIRRNIENNISTSSNLVFSDESIIEDISNTSSFRDENGFNSQLYKRRLFMINMNPEIYEQYVYQQGIRNQLRKAITDTSILGVYNKKININSNYHLKLGRLVQIDKNNIKDNINVTLNDINNYYQDNKESFFSEHAAIFKYIRLNKTNFIKSINITDDELLNIYNKNIKSGIYKLDDLYELNHLVFPIKANRNDTLMSAEEALVKLKEGATFSQISKDFNVDSDTKNNEGYLGKLSISEMPDVIKSNVADMKLKDLKIISTETNAIHVIQLINIHKSGNKSFDTVKDDIRNKLVNKKGSSEYYVTLDEIKKRLYTQGNTLEEVSKAFNLTLMKTPKIDKNHQDKILSTTVVKKLFDTVADNKIYAPIYIDNDDVLLINKINNFPPRQLKLEETESAIKALLFTQATNDKLSKIANETLKKLNQNNYNNYESFELYQYSDKYEKEIMQIINSQPVTNLFTSHKLSSGNYLLLKLDSFEEKIDNNKVDDDNFLDVLENTISEGDYNNFYTSKYNNYEIEINKEYLNQ